MSLNLDQKTKKRLKIIGVVILILILFSLFDSKTGRKNYATKSESSYALPSVSVGMGSAPEPLMDMDDGEMRMDYAEEKSFSKSRGELGVAVAQSPTSNVAPVDDGSATEKKVIKNGNISLKVEKAETALEDVTKIAKENEGEVFSSSFSENSRNVKSGHVTVKVPVANFDKTFQELKKVGTQVLRESTSGQDVTEQYVDLQAQLKNKKAEEETFVKILDQSGDIEDVLAVTKEISRVRGEIERIEGRLRYLSSQTDMSTIMISISEDVEITPVSDDWRPMQTIKKAFKNLIESGQDFVDWLIYFVIAKLPRLIVFALIVWVFYLIGRVVYRKFNKKKNIV